MSTKVLGEVPVVKDPEKALEIALGGEGKGVAVWTDGKKGYHVIFNSNLIDQVRKALRYISIPPDYSFGGISGFISNRKTLLQRRIISE